MATIKDISKMTGYSPSTVSIVLRGLAAERHISEETEQKILACVKKMNYQPNVSARRLRSDMKMAKTLAIFWANDFRASMVSTFLQGIRQFILETGADYEILICPYSTNQLAKAATRQALSMYAGSIICNASDEDIAHIEELNVMSPLVIYNRNSHKYPSIRVDNESIGRFAAQKLIDDGCKKLIVVSGKQDLAYLTSRVAGFTNECARSHSISSFQTMFTQDSSISQGELCAETILLGGDKTGIFVCSSDYTAFGVLKQLNERGAQIPENVEIICVGTNDEALYKCFEPSLTVIKIPLEGMAYQCAKAADAAINQLSATFETVTVPYETYYGSTTS